MNSGMEVDSQELDSRITQPELSRKRSLPQSDEDNDEEMVEKLLPAAAAMKRRKIEEQEEARRKGVSAVSSFGKSQHKIEAEKPEKPQKQKKEIDIQEIVRERREAEEDAARRDEDSLRVTLDGMNVEDMKRLAVVEEMQLPARSNRSHHPKGNGSSDPRWDEQWNGRKNFKKFRRRGETTQAQRGQSVIVPLEEVKKKNFGIGEEYLRESDKSKKTRKEKEPAAQTQTQSEEPFVTAISQNEQIPAQLLDGDEPETLDVQAPRITRTMEREMGRGGRLPVANGKRAAPSIAKGPAAKKQKTLAARDSESDSDSEDELKFRFKKK